MDTKSTAQLLKKKRLALGKTMKEVAEEVGVSETCISRWESGDISNMRRDRIAAYAKALQTSPLVVMGITTEELINEQNELSVLMEDVRNRDELKELLLIARDASREQVVTISNMFKVMLSSNK